LSSPRQGAYPVTAEGTVQAAPATQGTKAHRQHRKRNR
jgi:hypothetical protein